MRRLLMISPHFPPDSSAGTHRVRLLAPYLEAFGWRPTVLTVAPLLAQAISRIHDGRSVSELFA